MQKLLLSIAFMFLTFMSKAQQPLPDMGDIHNQLVAYLDSYNFAGKTQDEAIDDLFLKAGRLYDANAFPTGSRGVWGQIQFCGKTPNVDQTKVGYSSSLDSLVTNGQISTGSKDFLYALVDQTENLQDYTSFTNKVNELESGYNISGLVYDERVVVEGLLSLFKKSAQLWASTYSSTEITPDAQARFNIRCFLCVAFRDLKGAAIGFAAGTCLCAKLGVPNPAICGAVMGAVYGALKSWAAKVWPDVCTRCKKPRVGTYPSWICNLPF